MTSLFFQGLDFYHNFILINMTEMGRRTVLVWSVSETGSKCVSHHISEGDVEKHPSSEGKYDIRCECAAHQDPEHHAHVTRHG